MSRKRHNFAKNIRMNRHHNDIVIELSIAANRNVGLGEFTYNFARVLASRARQLREEYGLRFWFIVPRTLVGEFGDEVRYIVYRQHLSRRLLRFYPRRFALLHLLHQYAPVKYMVGAAHQLLTVHDINFIYEKSGPSLDRHIWRFERRLERADYLGFISRFAQQDTEEHFPSAHPRRVIYNGTSDLRPTADPASIAGLEVGEDFLLHISSAQPKKNVHLLVEMMRSLPEQKLVLVGNWRSEYGRQVKAAAESLANVRILDHVDEVQKASLYAACRAFLFPSLCEGFGLPPIEAMYFGKPVFLSTLTSLPEVGGEDAYYWDDLEPAAMATTVRERLLTFDERRAARLIRRAESFTWEKCVDGYVDYYLDLLGKREKN